MDSYFLLEFSLIKSVTHWWFVQFQAHCAMQSAHRGTGAFRQIAQVWVQHFDDCSEEIQMLTCCVYLQLTSLYKMVPAFPHSVSAAVAPGSTVQRQINHSPCNHPWCSMAGYKPQLASLKTQAVSAQLCKCSVAVSVVKELPQQKILQALRTQPTIFCEIFCPVHCKPSRDFQSEVCHFESSSYILSKWCSLCLVQVCDFEPFLSEMDFLLLNTSCTAILKFVKNSQQHTGRHSELIFYSWHKRNICSVIFQEISLSSLPCLNL